ncbi:MAG: hypothetical protein ACTSV7_13460 [Candidatus Baldrarchaeia archaeon]
MTDYKYTLHLDFDYPIPKEWMEVWKEQKTAMLQRMGFTVERIIIKSIKKPSKVYRGRRKYSKHIWVHLFSPRKLSEEEINLLQWLCCDDQVRVWINNLRIKRGLKVYWNKLFSRRIWVRPLPEQCKKCKIRRILNEMRKIELERRGEKYV